MTSSSLYSLFLGPVNILISITYNHIITTDPVQIAFIIYVRMYERMFDAIKMKRMQVLVSHESDDDNIIILNILETLI